MRAENGLVAEHGRPTEQITSHFQSSTRAATTMLRRAPLFEISIRYCRKIVIARSESDEAIQGLSVKSWIASLRSQ